MEQLSEQELALGHRRRALHVVEELRARVERWAEGDPDDEPWSLALARSLLRESSLRPWLPPARRGRDSRRDEVLPEELRRAIAILREICDRAPDRSDAQTELLRALSERARRLGDADEALELARRLADGEPGRVERLIGLATALEVSAETFTSSPIGSRAYAIEHPHEPALRTSDERASRGKPLLALKRGVVVVRPARGAPSTPVAAEDPALARREKARQLRLSIRDGIAVERYEEAIRIRRGLLASQNADDALAHLAAALSGLGRVHVDRADLTLSESKRREYELDDPDLLQSDLDRARQLFEEAVTIQQRLVDSRPTRLERRKALFESLWDLARVADRLDLHAEALAAYRSALVETRWLAARDPRWHDVAVGDCRRVIERLASSPCPPTRE
jgi:tetratricopeptide (TPR) repeat protein